MGIVIAFVLLLVALCALNDWSESWLKPGRTPHRRLRRTRKLPDLLDSRPTGCRCECRCGRR